MVNSSLKKRNFKPLIIAGVLLLAIGSASVLWIVNNKPSTPSAPAGVKLAPATQQEKKASDDNKNRIAAAQKNSQLQPTSTNTPPATASNKQVNVIITSASSRSVNSYVTGVFEDGGTCTATFTQGSTVVTRASTGFANVSYTQCPPISPDLPNSGNWSVVVSYKSTDAEGISQAQAF